ncbi:MAG: hypothetical protein K5697_15060 [Lachnospiraceae bacterium]|nr:hypothetical protein [Lachnospiraceae bacterium]
MDAYELYGLGREEYDKGNYSAAIGYFERSNLVDEHYKTYEMLFRCWKILEEREKAKACIERAYELNPYNDKTAFEYAEFHAEAGDKETAKAVLKKLIERNPTYKKAAQYLTGSELQ